MNKSEQINELAVALSKAQGAIKGAIKDTANPFFKSKYADLSSVWEACRSQLAANGLAVVQTPCQGEAGITVETMLMHSSGQWVSNQFTMPVAKADAQAVGSAITYARRYALAAMVGIAPEDDDGNSASGKGVEPVKDLPILQFNSFKQRIESEKTKDGAKRVWQEAVKACAAIGDKDSSNRLKEVLLARARVIDHANKEAA